MAFTAHQHRQLCKVTGIVVDLGVHDAPDLHLGLHWQRRLSFQEKQVRFCGKSNKIGLHASKTFEADFQTHPESNYSIIISITAYIHSVCFFFPISSKINIQFLISQNKNELAVCFRKPLSLNLALSDCELRRRPLSAQQQRDSTLSQRSSNSSSQGSSTVATWGKAMTFGEPPLLRVVGVATLVMDTWLFKKCLKGKGWKWN